MRRSARTVPAWRIVGAGGAVGGAAMATSFGCPAGCPARNVGTVGGVEIRSGCCLHGYSGVCITAALALPEIN